MLWFFAAGGLAFVWLLVHLVLGGREIAAPLLTAPDLAPIVRETQYLCWHFTSTAIAAMAGFFGWAAVSGQTAYAVAGTALALGFFVVGVALATARGASHLKLPQGWLFLPVALLGAAGLVS